MKTTDLSRGPSGVEQTESGLSLRVVWPIVDEALSEEAFRDHLLDTRSLDGIRDRRSATGHDRSGPALVQRPDDRRHGCFNDGGMVANDDRLWPHRTEEVSR